MKAEGNSSRKLIVAFTSPSKKEMSRRKEARSVRYVWRTSMVQLEPSIAVADNGGMSASVVGEVLELRSHGGAEKEGTSIKVDLARRTADVKGVSTWPTENSETKNAVGSSKASPTLGMRLTDLKCYRMPGVSVKVTRSG